MKCSVRSDNYIGALGASVLANALAKNKSLREVHMKGNELGNEGVKAICAALRVRQAPVTSLDFGNNKCAPLPGVPHPVAAVPGPKQAGMHDRCRYSWACHPSIKFNFSCSEYFEPCWYTAVCLGIWLRPRSLLGCLSAVDKTCQVPLMSWDLPLWYEKVFYAQHHAGGRGGHCGHRQARAPEGPQPVHERHR